MVTLSTFIIPVCLALYLIKMSPAYARHIQKAKINRKSLRYRPFDCVKCLSGWFTLALCLYTNIDGFLIIPCMVASMVIGSVSELAYNNITNNITIK